MTEITHTTQTDHRWAATRIGSSGLCWTVHLPKGNMKPRLVYGPDPVSTYICVAVEDMPAVADLLLAAHSDIVAIKDQTDG